MDEALISLLEKKDFAYISVKEICEKAGVNRSTFYLHYENTSDLLEEAVQYILDKHFAYYNVDSNEVFTRIENSANNGDCANMIFITHEYLTPYLTFIKENRRIFRVALKQFHTMNMDKVYDKMFKHIFRPILVSFKVPEREIPYLIKFYLAGVFSIVMEWLNADCKEDIDFVIGVITRCVLGKRDVDG